MKSPRQWDYDGFDARRLADHRPVFPATFAFGVVWGVGLTVAIAIAVCST